MMWSKTRLGASNSIYDDSWEELAFAEDTTGAHGGCIWPPRSYTCSFCRREFRSAQALGGHMNVHRRDRARLKQSPDPHHGVLNQMDRPNQTGRDSFSQQIRRFFPNPSPNSAEGADATPISPSMVLCQLNKGGRFEPKLPPYFPTSRNESRGRLWGGDPLIPSRLNWFNGNYNYVTNLEGTLEKNNKFSLNQNGGFGYKSRSDPGETNFPMSLSLATRTRSSSSEEEDEEEAMIITTNCKRRRMDEPSLPFLLKRSLRAVVNMDELIDGTEEELDLELRLGESQR